ncbi:MAG: hypothetical protein AB8A39_01395 [Prochlorococcus sp.]
MYQRIPKWRVKVQCVAKPLPLQALGCRCPRLLDPAPASQRRANPAAAPAKTDGFKAQALGAAALFTLI